MRNGILIRGLGRRSFEPIATDTNTPPSQSSQQLTPVPPAPASITSNGDTITPDVNPFSVPPTQHQLNTAQNEVLRKVSDLLKGKSGKVMDHEELVWENEVGLIVSAVDMAVNYLIFWPLVAIRNRIQTFTRFEGERLRDIFYNAVFVEGPKGLYQGMAAHLAFQIVGIAKELAKDRVLRWMDERGYIEGKRRRTWAKRLAMGLDGIFWVTVLYPMYRYSLLQTNLLLPATPLIPNPLTLHSFRSLPSIFPLPTPLFSLGTGRFLFHHLSHSSLLYVALNRTLITRLRSETFRLLIHTLPKPTNPDAASLRATLEFEGTSSPPPYRRPRAPSTSSTHSSHSSTSSSHHETDTTNIILSDIDSGQQYTVSVPPPDLPPTHLQNEDYLSDDEFLAAIQDDAVRFTESLFDPNSSLPTPAAPQGQTSDLPPPPLPPPSVAPRTRHRRKHRSNRKGPHHRVTTLSQHPADAAASQAGDAVANFFCLFLESAALRCLAHEFLPASRQGEVWGVLDLKGGLVNTVKSLMVEWAVSWVAWEVTLGVAGTVGGRWFGYPKGKVEKKKEGRELVDSGLGF
ncbi:hypothetical protein BJ508DRAFT_412016 [Ascobolus immersus RN42]|uniref:Mitochondrial carrier n=1 Tax=Ascobolus immersus RN42 TaxID=1160509 RepID=A0A3N4IJM6_ASCIM|nr:hypothetical protein BJ508DRAFT_412016 [Ascobolus immersus RN42]